MEQMNIDESKRIAYDLTKASEEAQKLEPVVFHEGDSYCCLLGPDPQEGIFGCGDNADEAVADWEQNLRKRLQKASDDDELVQYVKDTLSASNKKVW
jgi:hypothetical protein